MKATGGSKVRRVPRRVNTVKLTISLHKQVASTLDKLAAFNCRGRSGQIQNIVLDWIHSNEGRRAIHQATDTNA